MPEQQIAVERVRYLRYAGESQTDSYYLLRQAESGKWIADVLDRDDRVVARCGPYPTRGEAIGAAESCLDHMPPDS